MCTFEDSKFISNSLKLKVFFQMNIKTEKVLKIT